MLVMLETLNKVGGVAQTGVRNIKHFPRNKRNKNVVDNVYMTENVYTSSESKNYIHMIVLMLSSHRGSSRNISFLGIYMCCGLKVLVIQILPFICF